MIGILDSGLGGLAIARAIWQELPHESTIYLADHAYFPYGNKSGAEINRRLVKIVDWLLQKKSRLIVIACNTITAAAIDRLRQHYQIPFVGTEPAVRQGGVVLATTTTAASERYRKLAHQYGVTTIACPGLAEAIETGRKIDQYLPKLPKNTRVVVLGCTHYLLVKDKIQKIYGQNINLIDPSGAIARQTRTVMVQKKLLTSGDRVARQFFTTGRTRRLRGIIFKQCSL